MSSPIWPGRSVLLTGHTGFKGAWLTQCLSHRGAKVHGYALPPDTQPNLFQACNLGSLLASHHEADIRDHHALADVIDRTQPEVIFHLAAQALVRRSHAEPFDTFAVNTLGTAALLEAVRQMGRPCVVIVVTTDKCYQPDTSGTPFSETDRLGGDDPYSASKAAAELVSHAYRAAFFDPNRIDEHGIGLATVRAGNVIGGGDWAADRLVPDTVCALAADRSVPIRNPGAVRPWQHVLDPLAGYMLLAERMLDNPDPRWCTAWNFGPDPRDAVPVQTIIEQFCSTWGGGRWHVSAHAPGPSENPSLRLDTTRAKDQLNWQPRWRLDAALQATADWYRNYYATSRAAEQLRALCLSQIRQHGASTAQPGESTEMTGPPEASAA